MAISELEQLSREVMELTSQPELSVIERRTDRRRARRRVISALGVVVTVQLAGALLWGMLANGQPGTAGGSPAPVPSGRVPYSHGPVWWTSAADSAHLYALLSECPDCGTRLVGSDDGGRTWTVRQPDWFAEVGDPEVRGARTLVVRALSKKLAPPAGRPARVSTDGGRTWADLPTSSTPATEVSARGWLQCGDIQLESRMTVPPEACPLQVVDPVARTIRPLASPPGTTVGGVASVPGQAGLWVAGLDRRGKPAVSVSRNGGVTWSTHAFDGVPEGTAAGGAHYFYTVQVSTHDGQTVYAVVGNHVDDYGYRSTDGGRTWRATNGGAALPKRLDDSEPALALPDGTHVLQQRVAGDDIGQLFGRDQAGTYVRESRPGWPSSIVRAAGDGSYVANDGWAMHRSADGRTWTKVTPRG